LGLQATLFLSRPAVQIQARIESLGSAAGAGVRSSSLRGDLSMAGTLHLERSPRRFEAADTSTPGTFSTDADWNVRVYASQTRQEGDAAPLG